MLGMGSGHMDDINFWIGYKLFIAAIGMGDVMLFCKSLCLLQGTGTHGPNLSARYGLNGFCNLTGDIAGSHNAKFYCFCCHSNLHSPADELMLFPITATGT